MLSSGSTTGIGMFCVCVTSDFETLVDMYVINITVNLQCQLYCNGNIRNRYMFIHLYFLKKL